MPIESKIKNQIKQIVKKENVISKKEELACYSYDSTNQVYFPDLVVFPENTLQVSQVLKLAQVSSIPVIPRGAGTGLTGGSLATKGGIILCLTKLNQILNIDYKNLIAELQPGVITGDFHKLVEKDGFFYPPDPSSSAYSTIGGNVAECAGGPRAVKYGVTRDYVLGLEAVIMGGDIIYTGVRTKKGVVGYDLTRLLVGSEGTLAVITSIILKLIPLPKTIKTMTAVFETMRSAANAVSEIMSGGILPRTIEFMDQSAIQCCESYLNIGLPVNAGAILIIEVDGDEKSTELEINYLEDFSKKLGASYTKIAQNKEELENIWKARKAVSPALYQFGPDKINEDIVVPTSKIPDLVQKIAELQKEYNLTMASFGHAGDGNIHFTIMLDKSKDDQKNKAYQAVEKLFDYTIKSGGTLSGEHGIGITKAPYITKEINHTELLIMKKIKNIFDPQGLLNPGKIFPDI